MCAIASCQISEQLQLTLPTESDAAMPLSNFHALNFEEGCPFNYQLLPVLPQCQEQVLIRALTTFLTLNEPMNNSL